MAFHEHYHEVLDVLDGLFIHIFEGLETLFAKYIQPFPCNSLLRELEAVRSQYPFEPLKFTKPSLRLKFPEAVQILRDAGVEMKDLDDLRYHSSLELS